MSQGQDGGKLQSNADSIPTPPTAPETPAKPVKVGAIVALPGPAIGRVMHVIDDVFVARQIWSDALKERNGKAVAGDVATAEVLHSPDEDEAPEWMSTPAKFAMTMLASISRIENALDDARHHGGGDYEDLERVLDGVDRSPLLNLLQYPTEHRDSDPLVKLIIAEHTAKHTDEQGVTTEAEGGAE